MSKRSIKKRNRKPDSVKITFKGLVAAGQQKAELAKLTKLVPQLAQSPDDVMLEVSELSETGRHVHDDSCNHTPGDGDEHYTG